MKAMKSEDKRRHVRSAIYEIIDLCSLQVSESRLCLNSFNKVESNHANNDGFRHGMINKPHFIIPI